MRLGDFKFCIQSDFFLIFYYDPMFFFTFLLVSCANVNILWVVNRCERDLGRDRPEKFAVSCCSDTSSNCCSLSPHSSASADRTCRRTRYGT